MDDMQHEVERFFARYASLFNRAIRGEPVVGEIGRLYSEEFIAATPAGVRTGRIDDSFETVMTQGYERYRAIGTTSMDVEDVDVHVIDDGHCLAKVSWNSVYQKPGKSEVSIPFDVSYLLERVEDDLKVFGWVSGDEQELLREYGVV